MTMKNLRKRKVVCISWCFLCKEIGKDVHCKLAMRSWWDMIRWFGVRRVMPNSEEELFSRKSGVRRKRHKTWNVTLVFFAGHLE